MCGWIWRKKILHIFNSKYSLDKKEIDNLPIGLFGDFYSHELSFNLINKNDYKNLKNIFDRCNLKISKILLSFVKGSLISEKNPQLDTFLYIRIDEDISFLCRKRLFEIWAKFNFGTEIILRDISKIISLRLDVVKYNWKNSNLHEVLMWIIKKIILIINNTEKLKKTYLQHCRSRVNEISNLLYYKNINIEKF